MDNVLSIYPCMRMRLTCAYFNKPMMDLNLQAHIRFQGATSVEYPVLLFVIIFDIEDYIKIDVDVCTDIFQH